MNQDKEQRGSFRHPNMSVRPMLNIRSGSRDGRYTLVIQLIRERRRGVIFTPYRLLPEEFDHLRGKAAATSRRRTHTAFIHEVNVFLEKQKEGKKRMRQVGNVEIPQEAMAAAPPAMQTTIPTMPTAPTTAAPIPASRRKPRRRAIPPRRTSTRW